MPPTFNFRRPGQAARPLLTALLLSLTLLPPNSARADEPAAPYGLETRTPWTSSRLVGSPEPPLPYTVERVHARYDLKAPLFVLAEPGTNALWVIESDDASSKASRIVRIQNDPDPASSELLLELPRTVTYSLCFHPDYATNRYVYLFNNGPRDVENIRDIVTRYTVKPDPSGNGISLEDKLDIIAWKSYGHDGGGMAFGPDGLFYISTGDGTSDSDEWNSGQTLDDLLGAILRIDVDHPDANRPYSIPADNPFLDIPDACPEIYAYGLRNPWRLCSDPISGQIWAGSNGQDQWETAHLVRKGENYGWSVYEGSHPFYMERKRGPTPLVPPTIEHSHAEFRSLTGGVVYRGQKHPELDGAYLYGDYSTGRVWAMKHDGENPLWHRELADTALQVAGFAVDQQGEILIADHGTGLYRLIPAPRTDPLPPFPNLLSETGLFASTQNHQPAPGVIPYAPTAEGWNDGATSDRFLAVPGQEKVGFNETGSWTFPDGTALVQTLSLEIMPGDQSSRQRVETRVLLRQQGEWAGYSYQWDQSQQDATLVPRDGLDATRPLATRPWRFPSRADCLTCHSRAATFVLGISGQQLNHEINYGAVRDNQLRTLDHIGLFDKPLSKSTADIGRIANPRDNSAPLEDRARAYLHVNCAVCHINAGGGNAQMLLEITRTRDDMKLLEARPQHDTFGIENAMLVAPGAPERSVLLHRLSSRGRGQMPPLVTQQVDQQAVTLFRAWIAGLPPSRPFVRAWTTEDLLASVEQLEPAPSPEPGRKVFKEAGCVQCHKFETEGGTVGPDLNGIGRRVTRQALLESILEPSKVVADEYAPFLVATNNGVIHNGRVERDDETALVLRDSSFTKPIIIPKQDIAERQRLNESNMPTGTVNVLQEQEILELVRYLLSN